MSDRTPPLPKGENAAYWMVQSMGRATGADLAAAWTEGRLDAETWAGTVARCRGCNWSDGCGHWLETQEDASAAVPRACANSALFDRLIAAAADPAP